MGLAIGFGVGIGLGPAGDIAAVGVDYIDQILGVGGLDYGLFDFRKTDRLFQEAVGPTPADDNGELIGLGIGAEKQGSKTFATVMAGQSDTSGPFTSNIGAVVYTGGVATYTNATTGNGILTAISSITLGKLYAITFRVVSISSGSLRAYAGSGGGGPTITTPGTYTAYLIAAGSTQVSIIAFAAGTDAVVDSISVKAVPAHYAVQTGAGSLKPQLQAKGMQGDGSDDNLLTDWLAQAGANCIVLQASVPATLATMLIIAGAQDASSTNKFWLGVNVNGFLICGLGPNTMTVSATDNRGTDVVMALTCDGTTVKVFVNNAETYSSAQVGVPTTVTALRLGALNANGAAALFWPGSIRRSAFGKKMITLAEFLRIRSQWLAA